MNYTIELSEQEVSLIGKALITRPYQEVADIIRRIDAQLIQQQQEKKVESPIDKENGPTHSDNQNFPDHPA